MIEIFPHWEGVEPTRSSASRLTLSLDSCVRLLALASWKRLCGLDRPPTFNKQRSKLDDYRDARVTIAKVTKTEADKGHPREGYYVLEMSMEEVSQQLASAVPSE